jgi:hypothetical protein
MHYIASVQLSALLFLAINIILLTRICSFYTLNLPNIHTMILHSTHLTTQNLSELKPLFLIPYVDLPENLLPFTIQTS